MKSIRLLVTLGLGSLSLPVWAQSPAPAPAPAPSHAAAAIAGMGDTNSEKSALINEAIKGIVMKVRAKMAAGKDKAADYADEYAAFDALIAKYPGDKSDPVGQIHLMKAMLALNLDEDAKGEALVEGIVKEFAGTETAEHAKGILESIKQQKIAKEKQLALVNTAAPELHFLWSTKDGLKTLSELKGKVVVVDFWATWCGPCIASFPHMAELVEHYKGSEVVFVGVTSIQGRVNNLEAAPIDTRGDQAKELSLLPKFIEKYKMTWTVAVSQEQVFNQDYAVMGIPHAAVIGPDGKIKAMMHPAELTTDKLDAILAEYKLTAPAKAAAPAAK